MKLSSSAKILRVESPDVEENMSLSSHEVGAETPGIT